VTGRSARSGADRRARLREPAAPDLPDRLDPPGDADADLADGAVLAGLALTDLDWSDHQAAGAELDQCRCQNVSLGQVRLNRTIIRDVEFDRCDLANLRARESSMSRVAVSATRMTGLTWITGVLRDVTFANCRIDLAFFSATKFTNVVFANCRLDQANFGDAELTEVRFDGCDLTAAQFSGARLAETRFTGCDLTGLAGVTSLRGAIMSGADAVGLAASFATALGIKIEG
jgi:uncharacterized protein YjbI with pentapeptide repeats